MTCELSDATTVVKTGFKKRRFRGNLKVCSALMSLKKTPIKVLQQDTQNICQGLMYHWQILLSHSARWTRWAKSKNGENTQMREDRGKEIKVEDYRSAAGLGVMGWCEGQRRGEEIDLLPSMMCFLLRPRSVSALQQEGERCMSGVASNTCKPQHNNTQTHISQGWKQIIKHAKQEPA